MVKTATKAKVVKKADKAEKTPSRRSQQRLIALRMGLAGEVKIEDLREACRKVGVYNAPNFTQDMKKEATLFNPIVKGKKTVGWKLTTVGRQIAKKAPNPPTKAVAGAKAAPKKAAKAEAAPKTATKAAKGAKATKKVGKAPKVEKAAKLSKAGKRLGRPPKASKPEEAKLEASKPEEATKPEEAKPETSEVAKTEDGSK